MTRKSHAVMITKHARFHSLSRLFGMVIEKHMKEKTEAQGFLPASPRRFFQPDKQSKSGYWHHCG